MWLEKSASGKELHIAPLEVPYGVMFTLEIYDVAYITS